MKLVKDLFLATVILAVMVGGWLGQRLPFRYPIMEVGDYRLASFNSGLALSQLNRETPFYRLSPLNDFVIDANGTRSAHMDAKDLGENKYEAYLPGNKIDQLWLAIKTYWGKAAPQYDFAKTNSRITYTTKNEGNQVLITKTLIFDSPVFIQTNGMTLSFNYGDEVSVNSDGVTLANPNVPGKLTVMAGDGQTMEINRGAQLIEVSQPVNEKVASLSMTMRLEGTYE
jgi:hypothetical protein